MSDLSISSFRGGTADGRNELLGRVAEAPPCRRGILDYLTRHGVTVQTAGPVPDVRFHSDGQPRILHVLLPGLDYDHRHQWLDLAGPAFEGGHDVWAAPIPGGHMRRQDGIASRDLPGRGNPQGYDTFCDQILALGRQAPGGLALTGFSFGGALALEIARRHQVAVRNGADAFLKQVVVINPLLLPAGDFFAKGPVRISRARAAELFLRAEQLGFGIGKAVDIFLEHKLHELRKTHRPHFTFTHATKGQILTAAEVGLWVLAHVDDLQGITGLLVASLDDKRVDTEVNLALARTLKLAKEEIPDAEHNFMESGLKVREQVRSAWAKAMFPT